MKKKSKCMLCGKESLKTICESCAARVQGEVLHKRKGDTKVKD